ncbi:hypothetical protein F4809DRAFT_641290 [Biscogniauxia mediterranea]|nr:hypothetical protein F4809DRAFT_641290 [Biscogniauxia mediterranea]
MATPARANLLALPRIDTSEKMLASELTQPETETHADGLSGDAPKQNLLSPVTTTSHSFIGNDIASTQSLLKSATQEIAEALGVDASELPQSYEGLRPIHLDYSPDAEELVRPLSGLKHTRRDSTSSLSVYSYSPIDGRETWVASVHDAMQMRLTTAVAEVLGLQGNPIPRDESFVELGGNQRAAMELRASCMNSGMSISTKDIMNCKTIAELETCITPISPPRSAEGPRWPLLSPSEPDLREVLMKSPRRQLTEQRPPVIPPKAPARMSLPRRVSRRYHNEVEQLLSLHSDVSKAAVLRPKAGPFEGKTVAFVTLASCVFDGPDDCEIKLQKAYYGSQLPVIRRAIEARVVANLVPSVWVVLERMPLDEAGKNNRRKLQTWIQNVNDDLYWQIMSVELEESMAHPTTEVERRLSKAVSKVLRIDQDDINMNMSFFKLGGDSSTAKQLVMRCQAQGILLQMDDIMEADSLTKLASIVSMSRSHSRNTSEASLEGFKLSPMQRLYFHTPMGNNFEYRESRNGDYRFNQSVFLRLKRSLGTVEVHAAVEAIVGRHPMLRCRFRSSQEGWHQFIETDISSSYQFNHHLINSDGDGEVEKIIVDAQTKINVEDGPVFAAHHLYAHDESQMLYLVAHHLVVDLRSWQVIIDDLEGLLTSGHLVSGPSISFREWTLHQEHHAQDIDLTTSPCFNTAEGYLEYWGLENVSNTYGETLAVGFALDRKTTSMLEASNAALRTDSCDILMASLLLSFAQTFSDRKTPALWSQEHERSSLGTERDVSETVGWFTSLCPFAIDISPMDDIIHVVRRVKDSRRTTADKGISYFITNLMDESSAAPFASTHCPLELMFTFAGTMQNLKSQDSLLEQLPIPGKSLASGSSDIGRSVGRIAVLEVSTLIDRGEAKIKFLYNRESRRQGQIQSWLRNYERTLRQAIKKLQTSAPGLSLSDMPHMNISSEGLEILNKDILPRLNLSVSNIDAIYSVTANQQRILINQTLIPGSSNAQVVYQLNTVGKPVDIGRICTAWQQLTKKHPAMRTVFAPSASEDGLYDQIILRNHSPAMLFLESEDMENSMAAIDNLPPLPLTEGIPWHRLIVCQAVGKALIKLEISQAICDIASVAILFNELEQAYLGGPVPSSSDVSYPEYAQCLKMTPVSVEFWKKKLHDVQPCQFPSTVSRSPSPMEWQTTSVDLEIPFQQLQDFASKHGIEMATVLQVAWGLLLRTYIGTDDVCFGYSTSGRDLPVKGLSHAVGYFSNMLICRLTTDPGKTIAQLLLDVHNERQGAFHHQLVTVASIEHELQMRGDRLFNTCISFGYEDEANYALPGARFCPARCAEASEFDIHVKVKCHNGNITADIGHRILTYERAITVAYAFGRAIENIFETPSAPVSEVDIFSVHDHKQILAWNSMPQVDVPEDHVPQLVASRMFQNPEIQAVCAWDGDLTYAELYKCSMVLAKHLLDSGLKSQSPVPIIMDKSRWAVVAMLAVLTAGAIIVPVDAEATNRFRWIIDAVSAEFVLVSDNVRGHVDGLVSKVVIVNDQTVLAMSTQAADLSPVRTNPFDIACILFTTGGSKGHKAMSYSHGALATACVGQGATLWINPSSRVMQLSSLSVDIALSEIFTTLVHGGCVCVPSSSERIANFAGAACRMRVNWTYLTPTLSRKIQPDSLPDLSVVCFRTRQLDSDAYAPWAGKAKVLLVYGSAEACPLGLAATEMTDSNRAQSFGNPFAGNFWIVSPEDSNRLMPVGALGELVIGGPTLASGFEINDRDVKTWVGRSAARAKSLLDQSGSRLLKTGHYVRYREHGEIEFVKADGEECRIDGKSFRVSDIEPKLRRCFGRGVDVVVETIAFKDTNSSPILAAFVEFGDGFFHRHEDLVKLSRTTREKLHFSRKMADMVLRESLPSYMLPMAYVPVRRMPLTPSLKVNRKELQKLITGLSRNQLLGLSQVPNPQEAIGLKPLPLTRAEQRMRAIWAEILHIEEDDITANDGFLSAGGDIVTARDLVIICRHRDISISIIDVMRNAPLSDLCRGIVSFDPPASTLDDSPSSETTPSSVFMDDTLMPQIGSDRSMIEDVAEASSLQTMYIESGMLQSRANITYFMINISGSLDWQKLENACIMLTKTHPILRTAFVSHSRQIYQTVLRSWHPEFLRYQCQSWRLSNLATKLIKREQPLPIDFRRPITKFTYLDAGKSSMLVMRLSRAQYDDLSISTLIQDLDRFYRCSDLLTQNPGFCAVVRAAQSTYANGATEYWRDLLDGSTITQIFSQPSLASVNTSLRTIQQQIPTGSLQNLGIPFETILKGAWSIVLSTLSGSDDVVFGQLIDGKHLILPNGQSMGDIVGPTGNVIPVRTRLPSASITPYEYFRSVQSQHIASIPHENMQTGDIMQRCTSWPGWARFSTVVYHQNRTKQAKVLDFPLGNSTCTLELVESSHQDSDLFVRTFVAGSENVNVSIAFCEKKMSLTFVEQVLNMLCSTISMLTSTFVMEPMLLKTLHKSPSTPRIPLPAPKREASLPSSVQSVDPDQSRAVHNIISAAWDSVLEAHNLNIKDIRSVPFYELWGAVMPAAELAQYYTAKVPRLPGLEYKVYTTEEIIEHPTMMQQYELIIAKQQAPHLRRKGSFASWGKNIRKLTVRTSTQTPPPISSNLPTMSGGLPPLTENGGPVNSRGSSSLESLTGGSSNSDDDEPREAANSNNNTSTSPAIAGNGAKTPSSARLTTPGKGHKKGNSFLGKMLPITS